DYEPYGVEIRPATNSAGNTHQYTGHERDAASGLDYMHYRYHAANLGRFMKPDNVPGDLTTPQSWNLYAYALGSPVNFTDPTGHMVGQAWGYKMSGSGVLQNNGLGGGLNLGGHPFDDNPKGVIDWAIIDDVRRVPGSVVPHIELAPPTWTVTAGKSSLGDDWERGTFDADIGSYLQREAIRLRGELAVSVFSVNSTLTAFFYTADDETVRVLDRNFSMMEAVKAGGKYSYLEWTWTHLLHVHPPDNLNWGGMGAFKYDKDYVRRPVNGRFHVPEGPGPADAGACEKLLQWMGGFNPSQGVLDSHGQYWEYIP
ncbi:MAG: RHS repeat-associated core domain-containing protein, partial [Acidobacteriota bacterium]